MGWALGLLWGMWVVGAGIPLTENCRVHFATPQEGAEVLSRHDSYLAAMTPLDRALRLGSASEVTEAMFVAYTSQQTLTWDADARSKLERVIKKVAPKLAPYKLPLPEKILLVRTTGHDEGYAAYTRSNAIIMPDSRLVTSDDELEVLLLHELFHVLSRHNPELRDQLYRVVGFERCGSLELPEELERRRLTNPDAPVIEHAVELEWNGEKALAAPLLLADRDSYDVARGGNLFTYLQFKLLLVKHVSKTMTPWRPEGEPILLDASDVPSYFEKIGRNTSYIIHPEETLADNFVFLIRGQTNLPTPRIVERMQEVLKGVADAPEAPVAASGPGR